MNTTLCSRAGPRLYLLAALVALPLAGSAATLTHTTDGGNWNVPEQWSPDFRIPSTGDTAIVSNGRSVNVDSAVAEVADSAIISNHEFAGTLNVLPGGSLTLGALNVAPQTGAGTVNVSGGSLTVNQQPVISALGTIHVSGGQLVRGGSGTRIATAGAGVLQVSGGMVIANSAAGTDTQTFNSPVAVSGGTISSNARLRFNGGLSITGSVGGISCVSLSNNQTGVDTTFNYTFDADGVAAITCGTFAHLSTASSGVTINVDGSAYAGGPAVFDLVKAANIASLPVAVNVTGLGVEGIDYRVNQSTSANVLQVEILGDVIPGTNVFNKANDDYNADANWTLGRIPVTGDTVILNNNNTANLAADVSDAVPSIFRVGNQPANPGTLNINSGGKLAAINVQISMNGAADLLSVNAAGTLETPNTLNLQNAAGTLQVTGTSAVFRNTTDTTTSPKVVATGAGTISVAAGGTVELNNPSAANVVTDFRNATVTVNGGTITTDARIRFGFGSPTTLNIGGTGSLVSARDMATAGSGTVVNFTFDAVGVGRIACSGFAHLQNLTVNIDASALGGNGGAGLNAVFDLVEASDIASLPLVVNVTGAAGTPGVDWRVRKDTFLNVFQIVFGDPPLWPIFLDISRSEADLLITVDADDSKSGFDYILLESLDLSAWTPIATQPGTGSDITFVTPAPSDDGKVFYRVTTSP